MKKKKKWEFKKKGIFFTNPALFPCFMHHSAEKKAKILGILRFIIHRILKPWSEESTEKKLG